MTPAWIADLLAALMLAVAALSAARLAAARPWRPGAGVIGTDVAHLLMAVAMAGMLAPGLRTLPGPAWEAVFGLLTAWFAVRVALDARANGAAALAGGHCAPHLVHSAAMLYMFLALGGPVAGAGGMSGMTGGPGPAAMTLHDPSLAFVFALVLVGYAVWDLDQVSGRRYSVGAARGPLGGAGAGGTPVLAAAYDSAAIGRVGASELLLAPAVTVGCRIAMGVTMAFLLLIAI